MKRKPAVRTGKLPASFEELVRLYPPRAIRDEVDCENTQELIDQLTDLPNLTPGQADYLDTLATLLHAYEDQHFPIDVSDLKPADTIRFLLEQRGLAEPDFTRLIGNRLLAGKILRGEAEMIPSQIRAVADFFKVNPGLLL